MEATRCHSGRNPATYRPLGSLHMSWIWACVMLSLCFAPALADAKKKKKAPAKAAKAPAKAPAKADKAPAKADKAPTPPARRKAPPKPKPLSGETLYKHLSALAKKGDASRGTASDVGRRVHRKVCGSAHLVL